MAAADESSINEAMKSPYASGGSQRTFDNAVEDSNDVDNSNEHLNNEEPLLIVNDNELIKENYGGEKLVTRS